MRKLAGALAGAVLTIATAGSAHASTISATGSTVATFPDPATDGGTPLFFDHASLLTPGGLATWTPSFTSNSGLGLVPEPGSLLLLGGGLMALAATVRRRRRRAARKQ